MTDQKTPYEHGILVISRHAESEWNALGIWTGLTDVSLSEQGHKDARKLGELLEDITFNVVYQSELKRTHQTLDGVLEGRKHPSVERNQHAALNERDYGDLTGKNKWEVKQQVGDEAFTHIRRSWDYPVPGGETLKDVHGRVVPFYEVEILPRLQKGENVLVVAHGNSMRALIKHLEDIHEDEIADVELPLGHLRVYHIDPTGNIRHTEERVLDIPPTMA